MDTPTEDYIRVTRDELVMLLIEVQQRGCGGDSIQDQVDWIIEEARVRRATKTAAGKK